MYYSRTSILCRVYTLPLPLTLLYFYSIPYSIPYLYLYLHLLYSIFKYHTSIDALDLQPDWRASQLERRRQHPETSVGRQDRQAGRPTTTLLLFALFCPISFTPSAANQWCCCHSKQPISLLLLLLLLLLLHYYYYYYYYYYRESIILQYLLGT